MVVVYVDESFSHQLRFDILAFANQRGRCRGGWDRTDVGEEPKDDYGACHNKG